MLKNIFLTKLEDQKLSDRRKFKKSTIVTIEEELKNAEDKIIEYKDNKEQRNIWEKNKESLLEEIEFEKSLKIVKKDIKPKFITEPEIMMGDCEWYFIEMPWFNEPVDDLLIDISDNDVNNISLAEQYVSPIPSSFDKNKLPQPWLLGNKIKLAKLFL